MTSGAGCRIDLWLIDLDRDADNPEFAAARLPAADQHRAERLRRPLDRHRWAAARAAFLTLLAHYSGLAPARLTLTTVANGKPAFAGGGDAAGLAFNFSHAGARALFAIGNARDVGVDIERIARFADIELVARRVFTDAERRALGPSVTPDYLERFFAGWTRKEALIKGTGEGLAAELQSIDVGVDDRPPVTINRFGTNAIADWRLVDIPVGDGYRAALACRTRAPLHWTLRPYSPDLVSADPVAVDCLDAPS